MKPVCPRCQSSTVYVMTDSNELLSPAALIGLGVSLCKSFKVHPMIGVVAGTAIAAVIELAEPHSTLPMLINKQHRCDDCTHVFSTLN
ncbi:MULTISPECIES: hypothetical protein [unclassified Psychrobacter]|uniref:hypothetical protein n=1 Tax=unclassified Psychrobacter TaxID=196806 RepID=UPI0015C76FE0|nr:MULTISPECIES: hypothetical protein [unclassified Psychrobacter]MCG3808681.1 hypothetical protein [Psychrobacter sp. Ps4]NYR09945.1 hypothetical protein [Psychrobacter sp. BI730]